MLGERVIAGSRTFSQICRGGGLGVYLGSEVASRLRRRFREVEPLFRRELAVTESPEPFEADEWQAT
jgi:hypothetical protein